MLALVLCAGSIPAVAIGKSSPADDQLVSMRGTLEIAHSDDFRSGRTRHISILRSASRETSLSFRGEIPEQLSGSRVLVKGVREDGGIEVRSLDVVAAPQPTSTSGPLTASAPTTVKVAVVLFNFANDRSEPWSPDVARGVVLTNPDSAAAYYREVTADRLSLAGDVYGWFTMPYDKSACSPGTWSEDAKAALSSTGVDVSRYDKFVLAFPYTPSCDWNGIGVGTDAWVNGSLNLQVVAHELGHTFGLGHSKSMSCTSNGVRVAITADDPASCTVSEYGDPFDTMGSGSGRHVNNAAKASLGWEDPAGVVTVSSNGIYSLAPAEGAFGTLPQLLRIRRADGSWLSLEFRQPYGQYFDTFSSSEPVTNGVTIRVTSSTWSGTRVLDTTPETSTFWDAPLAVGKVFEDSAGGVSITTTAVSPTAATVSVTLGGSWAQDTQPPTAPVPISATATSSTSVSLVWTASTDNVGVTAYRVSRDGAGVGTVDAGVLRFTDGGRTGGRTYTYSVVALDAAGNVGAAAQTSATTPTPPDVVAPTAPANLTALAAKGRKVTLSWSPAIDDVGVAGYRVYRNGVLATTVTGQTYSESLSGKTATSYYVVALDAAGNVSPPSNTVSIR